MLQLNYLFQNFIHKFEIMIVGAHNFEFFGDSNTANNQKIHDRFGMNISLEDFAEFSWKTKKKNKISFFE